MSDFTAVPFDRALHGNFVLDSFAKSAGSGWPYSLINKSALVDEFKLELADPRNKVTVATAPDDPDTFLGYVVTAPGNTLVFAFVKYPLRRMGIGSSLCIEAGLDFQAPLAVRYWTRATERIRLRRGYEHLYFKVTDDE